MKHRPYTDADLAALRRFTALAIQRHGRGSLIHPGDISHRIYSGLRGEDPTELVHLWEDKDAQICGWVLLDPRDSSLVPQVDSGARSINPSLEREIFEWAEGALVAAMQERGLDIELIFADVYEGDEVRAEMLPALGWYVDDGGAMLTRRPVANLLETELPPGYRIRTALGVQEAGAISELHAAGFGSPWPPGLYAYVMSSPGYDPEHEILMEVPGGRLAGSCIVWADEINGTGYFESLAVHPAHRGLGLGKALLRAGLLEMLGWGMEHAEAIYEFENPVSGLLYLDEGFVPVERINWYSKQVTAAQ